VPGADQRRLRMRVDAVAWHLVVVLFVPRGAVPMPGRYGSRAGPSSVALRNRIAGWYNHAMAPDPRRSRPTPVPRPSTVSVRRRAGFLLGILALLLVGAGATVGWAITEDDETPATSSTTAATHATTSDAADSTLAPTTTLPPTTLPAPDAVPTDEYAPTPDVVHGTLALPTLGVEQSLHEGVTLTAIDRGPSHWPGTAMPGEIGNVVVAGHRVTHSRPFADLDQLRPGDPLVFTLNDGSRWTYELTGTEIVAPDAMHIVDQTPEPTATLFACHPKGSAAQRIVARFRLVEG
jgi:sortase A